jgi:DNA (cytosine-5)-methyltransferase 1
MGVIVDAFAGGGGASTGILMALGRGPDVAINHDPDAIALHAMNHPETRHLNSNVWQVDPDDIVRQHGPVDLFWASPDCKHFSKAKGGKPVAKNIRDLAWVVVLWAKRARPKVICLENVEEFQDWGPLTEDNRPCPERKGFEFRRWVGELKRQGYKVEWRELRACDYGAPTIRKRLFLIARRDGEPIVWPQPTHGDPKSEDVKAGRLKPWRSAASIIDWSVPCPSIFLTKDEAEAWRKETGQRLVRPLADATMRRIARGVVRYVLAAGEPFIVTCNHGGNQRAWGMDEPFRTVTAARDAHALITPVVTYAQQGGGNRDAGDPLHTVCASTKDQNAIAVASFIAQHNSDRIGRAVDEPLSTLTHRCTQQTVVQAAFMAQNNTGVVGHDMDEPVSTIVGKGCTQSLVTAHMMSMKGSSRRDASAEQPLHTVCAGGNHAALIAPFLMKYYGADQDPRLSDPLHTVTSRDRFGLVHCTIRGVDMVLVDIGMRMLTPAELYRAQGFPDSYIIDRTAAGPLPKTAQTRMCGNSVCPPLAAALVKANYPGEEAGRAVA